jgi:hypothetical protein
MERILAIKLADQVEYPRYRQQKGIRYAFSYDQAAAA